LGGVRGETEGGGEQGVGEAQGSSVVRTEGVAGASEKQVLRFAQDDIF
jgi:hypothetical protein